MKPLYITQRKYDNARLSRKANRSITKLYNDIDIIQSCHPLTKRSLKGNKTKLAVATLLAEYYSILFDPSRRDVFRPLTDLTLLFPTNEIISISPDTNFILVPLPLPTYNEWIKGGRCPFLKNKPNKETDEFVRDLDYFIDSETYIDGEHFSRSNKYNHTSRLIKRGWTWKELVGEARLFVYKYQDIPDYIAKKNFSTYPVYNIGDAFIPYGTFTPVFRKFTLLNIPPQPQTQTQPQTSEVYYKLKEYSKNKLVPSQLDKKFPNFFDFKQTTQQAVVDYFLKEGFPMNEYSIPQIKSGIKRLKNMIKYGKNILHNPISISTSTFTSTSTSTIPENDPKFDDYKPKLGRPKLGDQRPDYRVRSGKLYKPDGTVIEFDDIDMEEYNNLSEQELKNKYLSSNKQL